MKWKTRWGYEMAATPTRRGIYRLKDGGYFVRARVTNRLGKRREVSAVLRETKTTTEAQAELDKLVADARAEARGQIRTRQTWRAFAISRLQERMRKGKVASEATVDWWKDVIEIVVPVWGDLDAREVTHHHINAWLDGTVATWMTTGRTVMKKRRAKTKPRRLAELIEVPVTTVIKPVTVNGWLRVLRAISHAIKAKWDLPKSAFDGVDFFEEGRTYTREQPNALPPGTLERFMLLAREKYPQHFAMILLGFVTGLRPSSLRPLRRCGPEADIDWNTGLLQIRRSHSRRQHVMDRTKTDTDNTIALPPAVLTVLREHAGALTGKQLTCDLLFPSETGGLRTRGILAKPFKALVAELGLPFKVTPRGMRRTFNDLARRAGIHDVVTRSISGHQTEAMQVHYSTAQDEEKRAALTKVHGLMGPKPDGDPHAGV
jgi:integrase